MFQTPYAWMICAFLGISAVAQAQNPDNAGVFSPTLKIFVLQGQAVVNSTVTRTATVPVVEVRDENDRPVEGAEVVFEAPVSGPGGVFVGGKPVYQTISGLNGQAVGRGFSFNDQPGPFVIRVTARFGQREGRAEIRQVTTINPYVPGLTAEVSRPWWKRWWVLGLIGGGVAGGVYLGSRNGSTSSDAITIAPGPIVIGGAR